MSDKVHKAVEQVAPMSLEELQEEVGAIIDLHGVVVVAEVLDTYHVSSVRHLAPVQRYLFLSKLLAKVRQ